MNTKLCECSGWATDEPRYTILTGHHYRCAKGPNGLEAAYALIAELATGINAWACDEDGVPDELYEAWRKAMAISGKVVEAKK